MIKLKVSSNGAIYPNRGINVGMKYDNTNETIEFVLPEALAAYNKYVVYSNINGTFLAPLVDNTWTIRSNITNYPGTIKCLFLLSETELDPNNFEIDNVATFLKVSGEFQINVANHFLKPEQVTPEEESPEFKVLFNHMMTLYNFFAEAKETDYYRGAQGPSTIAVGSTQSGLPTENATITNVGTDQDLLLNFKIPRGMPGSTPIKGIDYNTHEDGHFLLKDQGLGAHLQYKIDGVITNNGVFPSKSAIVDAYNEMYAETEEEVGLYNHLYLANQFGPSADPLETVVLEGITWYNTYTWNASTYLGGTGDAIQIGSNANPIRYFEHLTANSFTNVTKIQIKLSRAAVATEATYSIYIGDIPITENASIPTSREEFQVYEFDAISGPLKLVFNHIQGGALYLGTLQVFATNIYEFDRAQWHWAQIQTEEDEYKYSIWVSTDKNNDIQFASIDEWGEIIVTSLIQPLIWEALVELRDNSQLVPGQQYRITDYTTTTTQPDTQSAGHAFDLIVTADDVNKINENARVCLHNGDTYFNRHMIYVPAQDYRPFVYASDANELQGSDYFYAWYNAALDLYLYTLVENPVPGVDLEYCRVEGIIVLFGDGITSVSHIAPKLEAWQLKYCLDNDTTRFAWADTVNGKGVIYRMIDEWNNDCPYDFKNIKFLRDGIYYYTFTAFENTDETIKDASIMRGMSADDMVEGMTYNSMKPYYIYIDDFIYPQALNFNIFKSYYDDGSMMYMPSNNHLELNCYNNFFDGTEFTRGNTFGNNCYYNIFGNSCYSNTFGNNCYSNTFGNGCSYNTLGNDCSSNTFGNGFSSNTFGNNCSSNTFGDSCFSNTFSDECDSNTFGDSCSRNTFGNDYNSNTFGNDCNSNTFGNGCYGNTFGVVCNSNTFGSNCHSNTFGNGCQFNTLGNNCQSNTFGDFCDFNAFANNCDYLTISDNTFTAKRYINVDSGVKGASSTNKLDLYDSAILGKGYQISFKQSASGRYLMLWATDTGTMTGKYKATNIDATWTDL